MAPAPRRHRLSRRDRRSLLQRPLSLRARRGRSAADRPRRRDFLQGRAHRRALAHEREPQLSVQKTINERTSLSGSVFAQGVSYDSAPSTTQVVGGIPVNTGSSSGPNGMSYGASLRGSFYATPQIYVFV